MTKLITVSVPDEIHKKMQEWKGKINFSKTFQAAIIKEIDKKRIFKVMLEQIRREKKSPEQYIQDMIAVHGPDYPIWSDDLFFEIGYEAGFYLISTLPYPFAKAYEKYVESWDENDFEELEKFDLLLNEGKSYTQGYLGKKLPKALTQSLDQSFRLGLMKGVIDFIKEEYSLSRDFPLNDKRFDLWLDKKNKGR